MENFTSAFEDKMEEYSDLQTQEHGVNTNERNVCLKLSTPKITDLPPEVVQLILQKLSFENIAKIRLVSSYFNNMCSSLLNSEFNNLRALLLQRFNGVKALMPRRESARRKHPLSRESDILETLYMRLSLLHVTFGKYIENKSCCFFPGEIIDESYRILRYIDSTPNLNRAYKVTDELFDLSTMALEYFKENIEPRLPEIFLTYDMLHNPPLITTGIDLVIQKAKSKLMHMEITDTSRTNETPQLNNNLLTQFVKDLKKTQQLAKKNKSDIAKIKRSLKVVKAKVRTAMREVRQVKWQQNSCKKLLLNDVLYNMEVQKQESSSHDTTIHNPSSGNTKIS